MGKEVDKIERFCELVTLINERKAYLAEEASSFYDGGHTFEEVYADDIKKHNKNKQEMSRLIRHIASPRRIGGFG